MSRFTKKDEIKRLLKEAERQKGKKPTSRKIAEQIGTTERYVRNVKGDARHPGLIQMRGKARWEKYSKRGREQHRRWYRKMQANTSVSAAKDGQPWTTAEVRVLYDEIDEGLPFKRIAELHQRTFFGIQRAVDRFKHFFDENKKSA